MTLLPVAERELRVASRKRSTFWTRIIAALVALVIGLGFFILMEQGALGASRLSFGKGLFSTLTWLSLAVALTAGLFFTSDCLSEEKREGTLGFLFLTDLRGYDVVLGKLLATSLRGCFAMFAVLPVLAVTLLMGGVTGALFWKTCLALLNAMFMSLAAGLFVSSISRDAQKAMAGTLLLLLLIGAGGPLIDTMLSPSGAFQPIFSASSPVYLFMMADARWPAEFWSAFAANEIVAWLLLTASCRLLPRTWQTKSTKLSRDGEQRRHSWKYTFASRRAKRRRKLLDINPVLWLASRELWQTMAFCVITLLLAGVFALLLTHGAAGMSFVWNWLSGPLLLLLYLGMASQAGRFFVDAQRSGLIELMLSTPLTARAIVRGQWRALLRMFGVPLLACILLQAAGSGIAQYQSMVQMRALTVGAAAGTNQITSVGSTTNTTTRVVVSPGGTKVTTSSSSVVPSVAPTLTAVAGANALTVAANLVALAWFGMWMGMTSKNASQATLKTFLFVQILPWLVLGFASLLLTMLVLMPRILKNVTNPAGWMTWYPLINAGMTMILSVAKDVGFVIWSRKKLFGDFRTQAAGLKRRASPAPSAAAPPPLPPAVEMPTTSIST